MKQSKSFNIIRVGVICFLLLSVFCQGGAQIKLFGGLSIPMSDLASIDSSSGGFARPGFSLGIEYVSKFLFDIDVGVSGIFSYYPVDVKAMLNSQPHIPMGSPIKSGPWILFWPTASAGYTYPISENVKTYCRAHAGFIYGVLPEITVVETGTTKFTRNFSIEVAFGWGASTGITLSDKYNFEIRFMVSRPQYELNTPVGGVTNTSKLTIDTKTIQFTLGYIL
jgi:hypothetical protein